ncbi:type I restriction endonuclease subunit R [Mariprofundus erugo]|uniref:DEAD/DEAH box helicase family protein n=1 Tax=Mariprofundus erugo TaxID=2528639 RepID=UPI0010FDF523|nr:DEAD/DEAH box helicase family protein [Mariprofundus erugo]TLS77947.1 type I restriction endonuclease subunit R [Mariprofundus erugo]
MPPIDEKAFESHFCHQLEIAGYKQHKHGEVDRELCLHIGELEEFLEATQAEALNELKKSLGQGWRDEILSAYRAALAEKKPFELLRDGLSVDTQHINLATFKPTTSRAEQQQRDYEKNRFSYIRQYVFDGRESIDIVLFLNGIAIVTIELKNEPSGQCVYDAVKQYLDRDLDLPIFKLPFLHIAADNTRVQVAAGFPNRNKDDFRDFNEGLENPKPANKREYPVHYLYHDVLLGDSLLNIIQHYLYSSGERWVFPRLHQRRVVGRIFDHLVDHYGKTGQLDTRYLVQHSAGSGKSNTIVWLVQNLRDLSVNDHKLFHSVVVVTDRVNLDDQIAADFRRAIGQAGIVGYADSTSDLRDFLAEGRKVIVTTLHKFSYLQDAINSRPDQRICFIIDESHRSQSGSLNQKMTDAYYAQANEQEADREADPNKEQEELLAEVAEKSFPNAAFVALTATPSDLTLKQFGTKDGDKRTAFDTYTMDEAIAEGYILDVVKGLIPYDTIYKLSYRYTSQHEYAPLSVYRALNQIAYEDDDIIREKVDRMVRLFDDKTVDKIGGRAKAMVVTSSRLAAVKYKSYFDKVLAGKPYKALVAFSGKIVWDGVTYTEAGMNEPLLPRPNMKTEDAFDEDDSLRILIVANKFQTGFDQPLLHTMFLDKSISDINAVQTLSRLNRMCPGKKDTMTVDFTGSAAAIIKAFQKYQHYVEGHGEADPEELSKMYQDLLKRGVFTRTDMDEYAELKASDNASDSAAISGLLCEIKRRYEEKYKSLDDRREYRALVGRYVSFYRYIRALFQMPADELLSCFNLCAGLYPVLADEKSAEELKKELEYVKVLRYKIEKTGTPEIKEPEKGKVSGPTGQPKLSTVQEVIDALNKKFDQLDQGDSDRIAEHMSSVIEDPELMNVVQHNPDTDEELLFEQVMKEKLSDRYMDFVYDICPPERFETMMDEAIRDFVARNAYHLLRQSAARSAMYS